MFSTQRPHPLLWCERRKLDAKFPLNKCVLVYHHLLSLENERLFFQVILQHWEDFCSFDSLWLFPSVVIGSSCIYVKLFLACAWLPKLILFRSSLNRGKKKPPTHPLLMVSNMIFHADERCQTETSTDLKSSVFSLSAYHSRYRLYI